MNFFRNGIEKNVLKWMDFADKQFKVFLTISFKFRIILNKYSFNFLTLVSNFDNIKKNNSNRFKLAWSFFEKTINGRHSIFFVSISESTF